MHLTYAIKHRGLWQLSEMKYRGTRVTRSRSWHYIFCAKQHSEVETDERATQRNKNKAMKRLRDDRCGPSHARWSSRKQKHSISLIICSHFKFCHFWDGFSSERYASHTNTYIMVIIGKYNTLTWPYNIALLHYPY